MNDLDWSSQPAVMTVSEAARFLRRGEACVRKLCRARGFPSLQIGRIWAINRDGLKRLLEAQIEGKGW